MNGPVCFARRRRRRPEGACPRSHHVHPCMIRTIHPSIHPPRHNPASSTILRPSDTSRTSDSNSNPNSTTKIQTPPVPSRISKRAPQRSKQPQAHAQQQRPACRPPASNIVRRRPAAKACTRGGLRHARRRRSRGASATDPAAWFVMLPCPAILKSRTRIARRPLTCGGGRGSRRVRTESLQRHGA